MLSVFDHLNVMLVYYYLEIEVRIYVNCFKTASDCKTKKVIISPISILMTPPPPPHLFLSLSFWSSVDRREQWMGKMSASMLDRHTDKLAYTWIKEKTQKCILKPQHGQIIMFVRESGQPSGKQLLTIQWSTVQWDPVHTPPFLIKILTTFNIDKTASLWSLYLFYFVSGTVRFLHTSTHATTVLVFVSFFFFFYSYWAID